MKNILHKIFFLGLGAVLATSLFSVRAHAFDLGVGYGAVDSGDNRLVRSASLITGNSSYTVESLYYGTKNAVMNYQDLVISGVKRWKTGIGNLDFIAGVAVLAEMISYDPGTDETKGVDKTPYLPVPGPRATQKKEKDVYYNGAGVLGLKYRQPLVLGVWAELGWTSHIYPAGFIPALMMTADMHDIWTVAVGVSL